MKHTLTLFTALLLAPLAALHNFQSLETVALQISNHWKSSPPDISKHWKKAVAKRVPSSLPPLRFEQRSLRGRAGRRDRNSSASIVLHLSAQHQADQLEAREFGRRVFADELAVIRQTNAPSVASRRLVVAMV